MTRLVRLQLIGPLASSALFARLAAAHALMSKPSSAFFWYLNLEWFGAFQQATTSSAPDVRGPPFTWSW
jgi:hypothetical protein